MLTIARHRLQQLDRRADGWLRTMGVRDRDARTVIKVGGAGIVFIAVAHALSSLISALIWLPVLVLPLWLLGSGGRHG